VGHGKELTIHVSIYKRNQLHLQSLEFWNKHMENLVKIKITGHKSNLFHIQYCVNKEGNIWYGAYLGSCLHKEHFLLENGLHLVCWTQFAKSFMHRAPPYLLDPTWGSFWINLWKLVKDFNSSCQKFHTKFECYYVRKKKGISYDTKTPFILQQRKWFSYLPNGKINGLRFDALRWKKLEKLKTTIVFDYSTKLGYIIKY
jgi:hypothetical protein